MLLKEKPLLLIIFKNDSEYSPERKKYIDSGLTREGGLMALPLFKEKRFSPRKKLTGLLPGRLILKDSGDELLCKLVDVSQHGIGLTTKAEVKYGASVVLQTDSKEIVFKVAWIHQGFGKQDLYRIGLLCSDTQINIAEVFTSEGCLK